MCHSVGMGSGTKKAVHAEHCLREIPRLIIHIAGFEIELDPGPIEASSRHPS